MQVDIVESIADLPADRWNELADQQYPFLSHEFLLAAETTGCVSRATGWVPRHIALHDQRGQLIGALPLYEKTHSWGEFVFDWSWANAYHRAGLEYYPKLVSTTPFTPATSPRLLAKSNDLRCQMLDAACDYAQRADHSSFHVLFPEKTELPVLEKAGLKLRKDCQFHWHNRNFQSFDAFLQTFNASKRKKARRDRSHVQEQGFRFRWLKGAEIDDATWTDVYELISNTFMQRGCTPYFSKEFFIQLSAQCPDSILVVLAQQNRHTVAAAVFYDSNNVLYGRYWGSNGHHNALHFETCYYQGIDYCIATGKQRFEPGTQGEHKISRGFSPTETWSAHWLARPEFFAAISDYVDHESQHVDHYIDAVNAHTPYKTTQTG